jgi:hypothetical protein
MACKCSFRTAEEEEKYGSYCAKCWVIVKEHMKCVLCDCSVQTQRLYVGAIYEVPTCKKCFLNKDYDVLLILKGFKSKEQPSDKYKSLVKASQNAELMTDFLKIITDNKTSNQLNQQMMGLIIKFVVYNLKNEVLASPDNFRPTESQKKTSEQQSSDSEQIS